MKGFFSIAILLTILVSSEKAYSYAQFIAHGYTSCKTCHYNPYGGGPLNDYGRAVGATAISGKDLYSKEVTDEQVAKNSKFLGKREISKWIKPFANYRGIVITRNFRQADEESRFLNMVARLGVSLEFNEKFTFSGSIDYSPVPLGVDDGTFRSREHYFSYQFSRKWGVLVGFLDKVFGVRIPDHIAYSKQLTGLAQNDQSYGLVAYYQSSKWNISFNPFIGNFSVEDNVRQVGASTRVEYEFNPKLRIGASFLSSSSDVADQVNTAFHLKTSFGKGSALLLEVGNSTRSGTNTDVENDNTYLFSQYYLKIKRGLYLFNTLEFFKNNAVDSDRTWRFGPGIQYFPIQRVELRTEIQNTRLISDERAQEDAWSILSQVNLWF